MPFVSPNWPRRRLFWQAGVRAHAAIPSQVVDGHGEQNGAINQKVTLCRSDAGLVSLLTEDRAGVLECRVNGKHGDHSFHLHPRNTAKDARPGQGLWSSLWAYFLRARTTKGLGGRDAVSRGFSRLG